MELTADVLTPDPRDYRNVVVLHYEGLICGSTPWTHGISGLARPDSGTV